MRPDFAQRFDEFQKTAVSCIVSDFHENPAGRFLLVVPTGGGKTISAVKSVNALFEQQVYSSADHRVLWVAHRDYLLDQARDSFKKFQEWYPDKKEASFVHRVDFVMLAKAAAHLKQATDIRLVVIDEAHHAAASSYLPLFDNANVGVLGLTATPSRHDGKPLEFERETYSIGFPDLVERGVVLRPEIRVVKTGQKFGLTGFGESELQKLDDEQRNQKIIDALLENHNDYTKVVVYVGSVSHAKNLHKAMESSALQEYYDSISCITGDGNSRDLSRDDFLDAEKAITRSIVVNVDVLTEGYDDPTVNTVVMARPTNSKLVYMQAMGRAIRHDPDNELKKAYVVEVVDSLPNIRYRIDNRWLYADISDALEPHVEDRTYHSGDEFNLILQAIYDHGNVLESDRQFPEFQEKDRYGLLLFKVYMGSGEHRHIPILVCRDNRIPVNNFFNYLSERLPYFIKHKINTESAFRMVDLSKIDEMQDDKNQRRVFEAMNNSVSNDDTVAAMSPWITYFAFHHRQVPDQLSDEINLFVEEMVNADQIREMILASEYPAGAVLARFPLPLCSFVGRILHPNEKQELEFLIEQLQLLKQSHASLDHRTELFELLNQQRLPIESGLEDSLKTIVREAINYCTPLP
jgi:superfamily II DNA or RNA helicase